MGSQQDRSAHEAGPPSAPADRTGPSRRRRRVQAAVALAVLLAFLVAWSALIRSVGADGVVERIGVRNGYILVFLIASAGGLSAVTSVALYTTLFTLAAGGLNPLLLGLFAGVGLTIGDSLFYLIGREGRRASGGRLEAWLIRMSGWFGRRPRWALRLAIFAYAGFTPFPNDIMMVTLAAANVRYRLIVPSLAVGNLVFATLVAMFGEGMF